MRTNVLMMEYFEWYLPNYEHLWNRLKDDAQHLSKLGVTSVWTLPCYKGTGFDDAGYGTYVLVRLRRV